MVAEILVVCYCNNNKIPYKQEYSGQSSAYIIRSRGLTALQDNCYKKSFTRGILHFLSKEEFMWIVKDSKSNIFYSYMVQAQGPCFLHNSFRFYKKYLQIVSLNAYLYVNGRPY